MLVIGDNIGCGVSLKKIINFMSKWCFKGRDLVCWMILFITFWIEEQCFGWMIDWKFIQVVTGDDGCWLWCLVVQKLNEL